MQSMTGYGTAEGKIGRGRLYIEIKTLNHRYCEINFKMPPRMNSLEGGLREFLQERLQRGRVEFFIKEVQPLFGPMDLVLNVDLARLYQKALKRLQKVLKIPGRLDPLSLTGLDHFLQAKEKEGDYLDFLKVIQALSQKALTQVQRMRNKEGHFLLKDQQKRLKEFQKYLHRIGALKEKKASKKQLAVSFNDPFYNNKADITEEIIRSKSHVRQYGELLKSKGSVGRKLDFLIQEMHREMNTIGAKAADAKIAQYIVESKSLLENLREQVQNVL